MLQNFIQTTWKTWKMQKKTIFELYADDDKSKYSSNIKDIFESAINSYEKHYSN